MPADQGCDGTARCVPACQAASDNKGTIGCDYYAVDPDIISGDGAAGACFAAFIANTWDTPVTLTVEYGGKTARCLGVRAHPDGHGRVDHATSRSPAARSRPARWRSSSSTGTGRIRPGLVTDCPAGITPAITDADAAAHGTAIGEAFHITTDAPVVAYDIFPYGGGQSALDERDAAPADVRVGHELRRRRRLPRRAAAPLSLPFLEIVAQQDGTTVTISPTATSSPAPASPRPPKGTATTYTLERAAGAAAQPATIAGSAVDAVALGQPHPVEQAHRPLGRRDVPRHRSACCDDSAHQQIPPVRALGSEYVGVRYRNRYDGDEEAPPWRIVGAVDGTVLT